MVTAPADPLVAAIAEGERQSAQPYSATVKQHRADRIALAHLVAAARSAQERITAAEKLTEETQKSASAWMRLQKETEREANASLDRALKTEGERDRMRAVLKEIVATDCETPPLNPGDDRTCAEKVPDWRENWCASCLARAALAAPAAGEEKTDGKR